MNYVLGFDSDFMLTHYLDWLNQGDCEFPLYQTTPWVSDSSFEVVVSLEEAQEKGLSDYFFCGSLIIVSDEFKKILEQYSANLEFVPTSILCGENEFRFYALHVMDCLDVLDVDKSEFAGLKYGMVAGITKLALKSGKVEGAKVFMIKDTFTPILIVDEGLVQEVNRRRLRGMKFIPLTEYNEDIRGI